MNVMSLRTNNLFNLFSIIVVTIFGLINYTNATPTPQLLLQTTESTLENHLMAVNQLTTKSLEMASDDYSTGVEYVTKPMFVSEKSVEKWNITCYNATTNIATELVTIIECRCEGLSLVRVPQKLPHGLQRLSIAYAGLKVLRRVGLQSYSLFLEDIMLMYLPFFEKIEEGVFEGMPNLRTIEIQNAPNLQYISADSFKGISQSLRTLKITNCGLLNVPDLSHFKHDKILHMVDLEGNQIRELKKKSFHIKTDLLNLDNNQLKMIDSGAFFGSHIAQLTIRNNMQLKDLHENAFAGISNILQLDLSSTAIEELPTEGLQTLEVLSITNTHSLKTIPSVYNFKNLQFAHLTHPFHCCAFKYPSRHDPSRHNQQMNDYLQLQKTCINKGYIPDPQLETSKQVNLIYEKLLRVRRWIENKQEKLMNSLKNRNIDSNQSNKSERYNNTQDQSSITGAPLIPLSFGVETGYESDMTNEFEMNGIDPGLFHESIGAPREMEAICGNLSQKYTFDVKCYPVPDALNPCEDVMGSNWLRFSVWIVVLLAVIGNVAVLIVLFSNRSDVTVPKFLMSNLAFADFCMGIYLLLIAAIDAHSIGEYFNMAYDWQYGAGCKAAGFLTVFASHLSIFTLTIITLERWFAITYAIYLDRRIKLRQAQKIMVFGWAYSIIMASLPLFGVSNYSSTSICLPMEARDGLDVSYLISVLAINGLAFFIIMICYAQIYLSLGKETRQQARHASRGEMTVAKKMALLVFTNFACWAPIAFFGLTAIAGYPLIDVAKSKILLVFFYPINSCANPYLYAILTSQYRRDLFILLSKCGIFKRHAQRYKLSYSQPTNNTNPVPLLGRNSDGTTRTLGPTKDRDEACHERLAGD